MRPPRVVKPWTWPRALRDFGPKERDFLLAMLVLHTYCNEDGFTFVGLRLWAKSARMAVNTLQRHRQRAIAEGWLHASTRAGSVRQKVRVDYRLTVPDHVVLSAVDEKLRDHLLADFGDVPADKRTKPTDIPPTVSTIADTDTASRHDSCVNHADTDGASMANATERHGESLPSVSAPPAICVKPGDNLYQTVGRLCHPRADTEVLSSQRSIKYIEGALTRSPPVNTGVIRDPEADRAERIRKARKHLTADPTANIQKLYGVTAEEVRS